MFNQLKKDSISSWVLFAVVLVLIEILFFDSGMLFSLVFSAILLYFGRKKFHRFFGKLLFGFGLLTFIISVLAMFTLKILLIILIVYWVSNYFKSKKDPKLYLPVVREPNEQPKVETLELHRQQLLSNKWMGHQQTPNEPYAWEDIQLQNGVGDVVIDLSNTVLPLGESTISIRSAIGKVTILVPYELDVSLRHSVFSGSASVFDLLQTKLWNESVHYTSQDYYEANQKVKILTSTWIGDLEVKRV